MKKQRSKTKSESKDQTVEEQTGRIRFWPVFFRKYWLELLVLGLFACLSLLVASRHEPWRDEAQAWLIVRDAGGVIGILKRMGYEGTPGLWHLMLYPLVKMGLPFFSMQVLHSILASISVALILFFSPFPRFLKTLLPFGYHVFYQYGIVSRSYVLVGLFLFALASIDNSRFKHPVIYAFLILMLANVCVHASAFALVIAAVFFVEFALKQKGWERLDFYIAGAIVSAGFLLVFFQVKEPADLGVCSGWNLNFGRRTIEVALNALIGAFFPVIDLRVFPGYGFYGLIMFLIAALSLIISVRAFFSWLFCLLLLWAIFQFKHSGVIWHHGLIYMLFVYCAWIAVLCAISGGSCSNRKHIILKSIPVSSLFLASSIQLVGGLRMAKADWLYTYSGGKATAEYLRGYGVDRVPTLVATYKSYIGSSVLPYIPEIKRQFYAVETSEYYSFMKWDKKWTESKVETLRDIVQIMVDEYKRGKYERLLFIAPVHVKDPGFRNYFSLINVIPQGRLLVGEEIFFVYEFKPGKDQGG